MNPADPADTIRDIFGYARFMANLGGADTVALADCDKADAALAALLAVGERDKAEIETLDFALKASVEALHNELAQRERDRQHIAQLTAGLREIIEVGDGGQIDLSKESYAIAYEIAAAVLAGEEDAE